MDQQQVPLLSWDNISYDVKTKKQGVRRILSDSSGRVYPGELVAIMGASGAGKTTLVNILSGRVTGGKLYGEIKFNGEHRVPGVFKRQLAFVEQDELMHAQLTVEETLMASAQLRLSNKKYTLEDKRKRVETVMQQLRLTQVRDTKIGGDGARGVSGGERKRASIGIELVTDPSILVLDEPTSGLDSSSAEMVVSLTKEMAHQQNLCALMTIHQPSAEMVAQFDKLILLAQGKLVYMGPANQALPYFEGLGYPPTHPNPANFFIDLTTIDYLSDEAVQKSEQRVQQLVKFFAEFQDKGVKQQLLLTAPELTNSSSSTSEVKLEKGSVSAIRAYSSAVNQDLTKEMANLHTYETPLLNGWWLEMSTLLKRDWLLITRNWPFVYGFVAQCFVSTIFSGFVFFQMGHNQPSAQNRIGLLFQFITLCVFQVVFPVVSVVMLGRSVLYCERSAGSYRMTSYLCARSLSIYPLIYGSYSVLYIGVYFLSHLQYEASKFFIGFANMYALIFAALGMSFAVAMSVRNLDVALIIAPSTLIVLLMFAGNLSNANEITPVLRWIKYICIFYYGYCGFMQNEFSGLHFTCKPEDTRCFHTGKDVLDAYALNEVPLWLCIIANLVMGVGFYFIAYCLLRWKTKPRYLWI